MASSRGSIAGLRHWTLANLRVKVKAPDRCATVSGAFFDLYRFPARGVDLL